MKSRCGVGSVLAIYLSDSVKAGGLGLTEESVEFLQSLIYSYVGIVAPADKKAVYMGYAFLYGVIGSLIGSNLGGVLYESMLKPHIGSPAAPGAYRLFWLLFAALDVVAAIGLVAYNHFFAEDTPATNRAARRIMTGIYLAFLGVGGWFFYDAVSATAVAHKTLVQAVILLLIGIGGILVSLRRPAHSAAA